MFPSHHGGFLGGGHGYAGEPEAFAAKVREVLDVRASVDPVNYCDRLGEPIMGMVTTTDGR